MSETGTHGKTPAGRHRFLAGYGPLVGIVAAFLLMVSVVPTVGPPDVAAAGSAGAPVAAAVGEPCRDRAQQIPDDGYSPPCFAFTGSNGGATSRGVTGDTIRVSARLTTDPVSDYRSLIARLVGLERIDSPADVRRTTEALVEYFNTNFQFYGRELELVEWQGSGAFIGEILGGGQEQANTDAIKVATDLEAFVDITAASGPYADALARQEVIALGAPYMSREWFVDRRPYAWSIAPDCSILAEASAEYANKRLVDAPARWAGGALRGKPRRIGLIAPDNPEYQQCAAAGIRKIRKAGNDVEAEIAYSLDLSTLSTQSASIVAKLKSKGITSVACACDPLLPVYLTAEAREQHYEPEWLVMGTALTDTDILGQLYDQSQWSRAFGASALADQPAVNETAAYRAYKTVRSDEPAIVAPLIYFQLYQLAIGIQMAGPTLTPETFERGMFAYPEGRGEAGAWGFGPGKYTPQLDAQEIWWDPDKVSPYNDKLGAYVVSSRRVRLGEIPRRAPGVFTK